MTLLNLLHKSSSSTLPAVDFGLELEVLIFMPAATHWPDPEKNLILRTPKGNLWGPRLHLGVLSIKIMNSIGEMWQSWQSPTSCCPCRRSFDTDSTVTDEPESGRLVPYTPGVPSEESLRYTVKCISHVYKAHLDRSGKQAHHLLNFL